MDQLNSIVQALRDGFSSVAPQAYLLTFEVIRIQAIQNLVVGAVLAVLAILGGLAIKTLHRRCKDDFELLAPLYGIGGTTVLFLAIIAITHLASAMTWATLFNPEIGLANEVLQRLLRR